MITHYSTRGVFMKFLAIASVLLLSSAALLAEEVRSSKNTVNIARVVKVVNLVNKVDIMVNVAVVDNGGTTDVSPTQEIFFNIYSKGEMFSTDASFRLGYVYSFKNATRVSGGVYEVQIEGLNSETSMPENQTLVIDAQKAIVSLKSIQCEDFDCDASTKFEAIIQVNKK